MAATYDESLVRRFEPGTVEGMTKAVLQRFGYTLHFTRGLKSVRVRDRHDNYKKLTWAQFEVFVDDLRVKAGLEPMFRKQVTRRSANATKVAVLKALKSEDPCE